MVDIELCQKCLDDGRIDCWFLANLAQIIALTDERAINTDSPKEIIELARTAVHPTITIFRREADGRSCPNFSRDPRYAGRQNL